MTGTAYDMVKVLDRHYHGPPGGKDTDSYATWTELTEPHGRRIDYLALSLWDSRGRSIDGHEIKVSRADWLSELAKPSKAEAWWPVCHRWWLVVPHESIVQEGELPDGWGLMVPPTSANRRAMKVVVKPAHRDIAIPTWLTIAMVKRDRRVAAERLHNATTDAHRRGIQEQRDRQLAKLEKQALTPDQSERLATLDSIEQQLGQPVRRWSYNRDDGLEPRIAGLAIQFARALAKTDPYGHEIHRVVQTIEQLAKSAKELSAAHLALQQTLTKAVAA